MLWRRPAIPPAAESHDANEAGAQGEHDAGEDLGKHHRLESAQGGVHAHHHHTHAHRKQNGQPNNTSNMAAALTKMVPKVAAMNKTQIAAKNVRTPWL